MESDMTPRNQLASDSLPSVTTYGAPTAVPSDITSSTVSPFAHRDSTVASGDQEGSTSHHGRTLTSMLRQKHVSRYHINYSEARNGEYYRSHKLSSHVDQYSSQVNVHDEAMERLVDALNVDNSHDHGNPKKDVAPMVEKFDNKDSKTHFAVGDAEECDEVDPSCFASITITTETIAHHAAKKVAEKFSTGTRKSASVLRGLKRSGHEQL